MSIRAIFTVLALVVATAFGATRDWPLRRTPDLSSGFGDWRPRRFHTGIDIRTGGRIGADLYSPIDGWVYRVRASYDGYGKALYIQGDDGLIYVYAHLDGFSPKIDRVVKQNQVASQRYYVNLTLPPDSIRVSKGEKLGETGKTGSGAPHLHFETRTADNTPVNPLKTGFVLDDRVRPTFARIGFQLIGPRDLFADADRKKFVRVADEGSGRFGVNESLAFDRPFGVLADCYDQTRTGGMRQSIYDLELKVDGQSYYRIVLDSLDFETGFMSDLEFDHHEIAEKRKRVRRLYQIPGNQFISSRALVQNGAVIGGADFPAGLHEIEIVGRDAFSNKSSVQFEFLWRPDRNIMTIDSSRLINDTTLLLIASPTALLDSLDVAEIIVQINERDGWQVHDRVESAARPDDRVAFRITHRIPDREVWRLAYRTKAGALLVDRPASGLIDYATKKFDMAYDVLEDGLLVTVNTVQNRGYQPHLRLYNQGEMLGYEWPQRYYGGRTHYFLVPPEPQYEHIDLIQVCSIPDTTSVLRGGTPVDIWLVGDEPLDVVHADSSLSVAFEDDHFYSPRFVQFEVSRQGYGYGDTNSFRYRLVPDVFLTRKDFDLSLRINTINQVNDKSGLCWYDETEAEWIWLGDSRWDADTRTVTGSARGGGEYAAILDLEPPVIYDLNIEHKRTYFKLDPTIIFSIEDNLSGIADDRSIDIRLDGEWMIPEFDPESGRCKTTPLEPLAEGNHHLGITVTDRAGNKAEHYIQFSVKQGPSQK